MKTRRELLSWQGSDWLDSLSADSAWAKTGRAGGSRRHPVSRIKARTKNS